MATYEQAAQDLALQPPGPTPIGAVPDLLGVAGRGLIEGSASIYQQLNGRLGNSAAAQDMANLRREMQTNEVGDAFPVNTPENQNLLTHYVGGAARTAPVAAAFSVNPLLGLGLGALGTQQSLDDQSAARQAQIEAGFTPDTPEANAWWEHAKGAGTLIAFGAASKLAPPLLRGPIAATPSLLRPAAGVVGHSLSNFGIDAALRTGEHALMGQPLAPFASAQEAAEAAGAATAFGIHGGVAQAQHQTRLINKLGPDIAAGKPFSAAELKASGLPVPENYEKINIPNLGEYFIPKKPSILPNASKTAAELAGSTKSPETETATKEAEAAVEEAAVQPTQAGEVPPAPAVVEPIVAPEPIVPPVTPVLDALTRVAQRQGIPTSIEELRSAPSEQLEALWQDPNTPPQLRGYIATELGTRKGDFNSEKPAQARVVEPEAEVPPTGEVPPVTTEPILGQEGYRNAETPESKDYKKNGGWKLHLTVAPENYAAVDQWLRDNHPGQFKLLKGGEPGEKDFTVYVGDRAQADALSAKAHSEIGDLLEPSNAGATDTSFGPKVAGRFDVQRTGAGFEHSGRNGLPYDDYAANLILSLGNARRAGDTAGVAKIEQVLQEHEARIRTHLGGKYGERFTGKPEAPPVTGETGARAQAEVAGETAKATEAAKQKTAEERIAAIDKEMEALQEELGYNEDGTINETSKPELAKRFNALAAERVALFNGDESSLGKTPVTETGDTGVPPSVGEDTQRGAGVSGDEGVSGERGAKPVPKYDTAVRSSDKRTAYVSVLGDPESTITVSAKTQAELERTLRKKYGLGASKKEGVYVPISELAKKSKPVETKPNEAPIQEPISTTPDNAGTNVQGEQGAGPGTDAGVAAGVKPSAANGEAPRSALKDAKGRPIPEGFTQAEGEEYWGLMDKRKLSKAETKRLDDLTDKIPAPHKNVDGLDKSSAADLVRSGTANGHDLLSKIADTGGKFSDLARHLADRFAPLLRALGVDYGPNSQVAHYNTLEHRAFIGEKRLSDDIVVHELVHGITANVINNAVRRLFPKLGSVSGDVYIDALRKTAKASGTERPVKDIINQYFHYLDSLPKEQRDAIMDIGGLANRPGDWRASKHPFHYGATSLHEFISEAFTDNQFRRDLNHMKAPGGGTIWSKIVESVRKLLGVDVDQKSLLAAVLDTSGKLGDLNKPNSKGEYGLIPAKRIETENERSPLARPEEEGKDRIPEGFTENRLGTTYQDVPSTNEGRTVRFGGPAGEVRGEGGEAQQGAPLRSGDNAGGARVGEAPLPAKHVEEAPTPATAKSSFTDKLTEAFRGNKYGARLIRRLQPGVRDVDDTIVRTIDGKDAESAKAAGMVRDTLNRELPDKKDQSAAYVVLDNGGGRAGDADSTAAENLAFHRLQEQRAFLEEQMKNAKGEKAAQEIQDKIASIEENMARLQEPAPTVDEVKARIQTEIDKGQAALENPDIPEERKKVIRENLPHYQHALDNAERLAPAAKLAKRAYDDAYLLRQSVDPTGAYYQDYAGRLYEYNETRGGAQIPPDSLIGGRSGVQRYNKQRSYDTLMDAMIGRENSQGTWEGETPLSLALPDVVANHVKNSNDFVGNETVKDDLSLVRDPQTDEPILLPKLKPGQEAPANYVKVNGPSGEDTWVYKPFADIFRTVWAPDAFNNSDLGRVSGTAASVLKHGTVAYDVFHPSRLTQIGAFEALADGKVFDITGRASRLKDYYNEVVRPAFNGEHGAMGKFLSLFNVDARDIDRYVEKGTITKETAEYLRGEGKTDMKQMREGGLRPQLFVDNLWKGAEPFLRKMFSKVHAEGVVNAQMKLNKMTFERLAPAMMASVFKWRRAELARQNTEMKLGMSDVQLSRQAAKETNERFGNMGKSGPLKSATANSLAQRIALAPHWVISQAMSEARGVAQMGKAVLEATYGRKMPNGQRQRILRMGNSAKFLATTMGTVFALNQLVNMATRGHPTWQNPEDDHKLDAWLPGGKTGFFYSPTTLAAEYSHHFHNYHKFESAGSAIAHIATNKLSPMGQAVKIALTQKNYKNEKLSTLGTMGEVAKALTPVPISLGSAAQPINPLASPSKSGQLTNNLARTMGIQLDRAPDAVAQAYESFKKYRTKERPDTGPSPYRDLKTLVQNEASPEKIKAEVDRLKKDGKKLEDIRKSFTAQFHASGSVVGDINALQAEGKRLQDILTAARKQKQAEREYFFKALQSK